MDKLYVLKNDEGLLARGEKLEEEIGEVFEALSEYAVYGKNKDHLIEEIMDVQQVLNGILDYIEANMEYAVKRHNEKLVGRGWKFKKPIFKVVDHE